jgi:hypothetical protein
VTHPKPLLRKNEGTRSSKVAVHSTWVLPILIKQDPSAWMFTFVSISTERSSSKAREEGRIFIILFLVKDT